MNLRIKQRKRGCRKGTYSAGVSPNNWKYTNNFGISKDQSTPRVQGKMHKHGYTGKFELTLRTLRNYKFIRCLSIPENLYWQLKIETVTDHRLCTCAWIAAAPLACGGRYAAGFCAGGLAEEALTEVWVDFGGPRSAIR